MDPDQTAPIGVVCSGSTLFASILNSSVKLGNYLQQTTSADNIFRRIFFLGALRETRLPPWLKIHVSDTGPFMALFLLLAHFQKISIVNIFMNLIE